MANKELLAAYDNARDVLSQLVAVLGVEIESVYLSDMGLGQTRAAITLCDGIERAAASCGASVDTRACPGSSGFEAAYFVVDGVSVVQYRDGGGPDAKTT